MLGNIGYINREVAKEMGVPLEVVNLVMWAYFREIHRAINHEPYTKIRIPKIGYLEIRMSKAKSLARYYINRLRALRKLEKRDLNLESDYESKLRALLCQIEEHRRDIISKYVKWNTYLIDTYGDKAKIKYNYHLFDWKFLKNEKGKRVHKDGGEGDTQHRSGGGGYME